MSFSWIPGADFEIEVKWTEFEFVASKQTNKTLSSITFQIETDGVFYFDNLELLPGINIGDESETITYVTKDDHSNILPYSVQHKNLTGTDLHPAREIEIETIAENASSALRVFCLNFATQKAVYADKDSLVTPVLGISKNSANSNGILKLINSGYMQDNSWNWDLSKNIFLGNSGYLTQVTPETGSVTCVANPISNNEIIINIQNTIILS